MLFNLLLNGTKNVSAGHIFIVLIKCGVMCIVGLFMFIAMLLWPPHNSYESQEFIIGMLASIALVGYGGYMFRNLLIELRREMKGIRANEPAKDLYK